MLKVVLRYEARKQVEGEHQKLVSGRDEARAEASRLRDQLAEAHQKVVSILELLDSVPYIGINCRVSCWLYVPVRLLGHFKNIYTFVQLTF